jgi:hypothetical protein
MFTAWIVCPVIMSFVVTVTVARNTGECLSHCLTASLPDEASDGLYVDDARLTWVVFT